MSGPTTDCFGAVANRDKVIASLNAENRRLRAKNRQLETEIALLPEHVEAKEDTQKCPVHKVRLWCPGGTGAGHYIDDPQREGVG